MLRSCFFKRWERKRRELFLKHISSLPKGARILDAGCGSGEFARLASGEQYEVTGVDISEEALEKARQKSNKGKVDFIRLNIENRLPFKDEEFDCIWCSEVLEHIIDINTPLSEFFRILRNGGTLLVTVPYHGLFKNITIALFYFNKHFNPDSQHIRFFTKKP